MNKCMYYKDSNTELAFTKQEHIIPAGLGGITKLPLGYVSDEANESFSPFELTALRHSFISINRNNFGPGYRGSLKIKVNKNPIIQLFDAVNPKLYLDTVLIPFRLGFLFRGQTQIIPQMYVHFDNAWNMKRPLYVTDNYSQKPEKNAVNFHSALIQFMKTNDTNYTNISCSSSLDTKFISIGYYNRKWFVCTSLKSFKMDNFRRLMQLRPLPELDPYLLCSETIYHFQRKLCDIHNPSFPLVYIKTAFNSLAFLWVATMFLIIFLIQFVIRLSKKKIWMTSMLIMQCQNG